MPFPLSVRETGVRMAAIPIAGIAGIKNVTETSAPEIGAPFASLSFTRIVLLPFRGGAGSVVSSIFVCGAFIAPADPAPGGGGTKDPRAACSWLSESIKKFAEVTTSSPSFNPFNTMKSSPARAPSSTSRGSRDRKSTRLNSSHLGISYAVFCLKKKKEADEAHQRGERAIRGGQHHQEHR